jgi:hypothetical protein
MKEELLFVNKKKQKNFMNFRPCQFCKLRPKTSQSFLLLFFKKEVLPFSTPPPQSAST